MGILAVQSVGERFPLRSKPLNEMQRLLTAVNSHVPSTQGESVIGSWRFVLLFFVLVHGCFSLHKLSSSGENRLSNNFGGVKWVELCTRLYAMSGLTRSHLFLFRGPGGV